MNIMAEENVMAEVMNLLEAEPAPAALPAVDILALREAACDSGFYRQMQRSNRREPHTRTSEAAGRQRCNEALQKVTRPTLAPRQTETLI